LLSYAKKDTRNAFLSTVIDVVTYYVMAGFYFKRKVLQTEMKTINADFYRNIIVIICKKDTRNAFLSTVIDVVTYYVMDRILNIDCRKG